MSKINKTISRFFSGSLTQDDLKNLFFWFNSEKGHNEINRSLDAEWNLFKYDDTIEIDSSKLFTEINKRISPKKSFVIKRNLKQLIPYAAIFILLISTTWFFLLNNPETREIAQEEITYTTIITENGQRSKVVLPDSSIVWLNSGTTLSYPANFSENSREISLKGQGFFEVRHDENKPFTVRTNGLTVTVLGTEFDVKAYPDNDEIAVVLESGKVQLTHENYTAFNYTMKPGELATYHLSDTSMIIGYADASVYSSWKEGMLIFRSTPMKNVLEKLDRWYNIKIDVKDPEVYNSIFTGTIHNESYEEIFRLIEIACPVHCTIRHNYELEAVPEIIITKK